MIFVDAGAMIAYLDADDFCHDAAMRGFDKLGVTNEPAFTTPLCIAEAITTLAFDKDDFGRAARMGREILGWEMEVVRPAPRDERAALALMESYAERKVGLVDCLSFVIMDARQSKVAFAFDRTHFVKVRKLATWVPIPSRR